MLPACPGAGSAAHSGTTQIHQSRIPAHLVLAGVAAQWIPAEWARASEAMSRAMEPEARVAAAAAALGRGELLALRTISIDRASHFELSIARIPRPEFTFYL